MCGRSEGNDCSGIGACGTEDSSAKGERRTWTKPKFFFDSGEQEHDLDPEDEEKLELRTNPFKPLRDKVWPPITEGKTVFFSRHGESEYNIQDRIGGDSGLSRRGHVYAKALGRYFNSLELTDLKVWTSRLVRTAQTARFVKSVEVKEFSMLNEIDSGDLDGLTYDEFAEQYPEEFEGRQKDKLCFKYPGGESYIDCCERLWPILEAIEEECRRPVSSNLLVVAHQAILRCIFGYLTKAESSSIPFVKIPQHTIMQMTWDEYGECSVDYVRMPIEHAEQCVVKSVDTY